MIRSSLFTVHDLQREREREGGREGKRERDRELHRHRGEKGERES